MASLQKNEIKEIIDANKNSIDLNNFTRYGGEQQDNSVRSLIPKLFRFIGKDLTFSGAPRYNRDIQDTVEQNLGEEVESYIRDIADNVFDQNTFWPFQWIYSVEQDYDGDYRLDFSLHITFNVPQSLSEKQDKYHEAIREIIEDELTERFEMPTDFEVYIRSFNDKEEVKIVYSGRDLIEMNYSEDIDQLEQMIDGVFEEGPRLRYIFDRYDDYSYDNTLEHFLEKKGFLSSDKYDLQNIFIALDDDMESYFQDDNSEIEFNGWEGEATMIEEDYFGSYYLDEVLMKGEETLWVDEIFEELTGVPGRDFDVDNEQHFLLAKAIYGAISSLHHSGDENMFYRIVNSIDSEMEGSDIRFAFDYDRNNLKENLINIIKEESGLETLISVKLDQNRQNKKSMFNVAYLIYRYSADDMIERTKEVLIALLKKEFGNLNERKKRVNIKILKGK